VLSVDARRQAEVRTFAVLQKFRSRVIANSGVVVTFDGGGLTMSPGVTGVGSVGRNSCLHLTYGWA
jgi:hypothetical protein